MLLITCELPTENIVYEKKPVVFGSIDAGFNRIEPIYLSWSNDFSISHTEQDNYIDNAEITISTTNNNPEYENIQLIHNGNGEYIANYPDNFQITPGSEWTLTIQFIDEGKDYLLTSSTIIPEEINLTSTTSDISWDCNGEEVNVNSNFNLYQEQNNLDLIQDWLDSEDTSFINEIEVDDIIYNTDECYTSSFASVPFFTIDLGTENESIISRYTTIALEVNKDMNNDNVGLPYEAAIFDTTLSANAFKGPMNYHEIDYAEFPDIQEQDIQYEWGWHRKPIDRINLTGNLIDISWLFFDYYGINMLIVQPMGEEYEEYFESDPDEFNFPYILRESNIQSNQGNAYGLFYSTNSRFFFFNVNEEQSN